jgi:hypothetical protein
VPNCFNISGWTDRCQAVQYDVAGVGFSHPCERLRFQGREDKIHRFLVINRLFHLGNFASLFSHAVCNNHCIKVFLVSKLYTIFRKV